MVGKRIDEILAEKANSNAKNGNSYFSPIVFPVVSSFKRIYKTRLSKKEVFKGKPLHTIEESSEGTLNGLNLQNSLSDHTPGDLLLEEEYSTLSEIRHLFAASENDNIAENGSFSSEMDSFFPYDLSNLDLEQDHPLDNASAFLTSPSVTLMQQFELAAKVEAAISIQQWYRQVRERQKFLQLKSSAIMIQRYFRGRR